jgi:hypothetical protein
MEKSFLRFAKGVLGRVHISQFVFHLLPSMNVTLCYANLPSCHTIVHGFSMVNYHQLEICIVASA